MINIFGRNKEILTEEEIKLIEDTIVEKKEPKKKLKNKNGYFNSYNNWGNQGN